PRRRPFDGEGVVALPLLGLELEDEVVADPVDAADHGEDAVVGRRVPQSAARAGLGVGDPDLEGVAAREARLHEPGRVVLRAEPVRPLDALAERAAGPTEEDRKSVV